MRCHFGSWSASDEPVQAYLQQDQLIGSIRGSQGSARKGFGENACVTRVSRTRVTGRRRPRIVFVDHVARLSGGEIALARLLEALDGRIAAHVILGEEGPLVERLLRAGAAVEVLPMPAGLRDARKASMTPRQVDVDAARAFGRYVRSLARRLRLIGPDLVHTNSLKAALVGGTAGRLARLPVLWHIRDRIAADYLPRPAVYAVRAASLVLPSAVVANSATTLATLPRRRKRHVVHGIVSDPLALAAEQRRRRRTLTVGVVGRLSRWKGQHVFLEAFAAAFPEDAATARIVGSPLFGENEYEAFLRRRAVELGIADRVEFRGFRHNVAAELAELDVLVHCSVTPEPFGQVVVEGMAAGLPVVAAAAGGPTEIITDGVDGLLARPGDAGELARRLRELALDAELRERLGRHARETSRRYSAEGAAAQMLRVYEAVLGTV
jgi:glycosyltransferase involved in cell wall biosynthesis